MARLEIRPFSDEFLAARRRAARGPPPRAPRGRAAAAARGTRIPRPRATRSRRCSRSTAPPARSRSAAARVVGYLLGVRKSDEIWGPNVWVELAGHAVEEPEDLRDLYAAAADELGRRRRAPAPLRARAGDRSEPLLEAWYRVGFGQQHAYGDPGGARGERGPTASRLATDDGHRRARRPRRRCSRTTRRSRPSSRAASPQEPGGAARASSSRTSRTTRSATSSSSATAGSSARSSSSRSSCRACTRASRGRDGAALLGWAATRPDVRGSGAGLALTQAAFAWARERGHETMVTDWRVTNLLASRFWPARGFRRRSCGSTGTSRSAADPDPRRAPASRSSTRPRTRSCSGRRRPPRRSPTSAPPSATRSASRSPARRSRRSSRAAGRRRSSSSRPSCRCRARRTTRAGRRSRRRSPSSSGSACPSERQTILVAGGLNRRAGQRELEALVAPHSARRFHGRVEVHDAEAPDLVDLGRRRTDAAAGQPARRRDRPRRLRHAPPRPCSTAAPGALLGACGAGDAARGDRLLAARDGGGARLAARRSRSSARSPRACR